MSVYSDLGSANISHPTHSTTAAVRPIPSPIASIIKSGLSGTADTIIMDRTPVAEPT